jgi:hypothetical protein
LYEKSDKFCKLDEELDNFVTEKLKGPTFEDIVSPE